MSNNIFPKSLKKFNFFNDASMNGLLQKVILLLIFGVFSINTSLAQCADTSPTGDCDSDTVQNGVDLDDDNDGILDDSEKSYVMMQYNLSGVIDGSRDRGAPNNLNRDFVFGDNYFFNLSFSEPIKISIQTTIGDQSSGRSGNVIVDGNSLPVSTTAGNFQTVTHNPNSAANYAVNLVGTDLTMTQLTVRDFYSNVIIARFDFGTTTSPVASGFIQMTETSTSPQEIYLESASIDTDQDNIPNYLDLDSDGDGCPDAIEGGLKLSNGVLVASSMSGGNTGANYNGSSPNPVFDNLGISVDSEGIPTIAGSNGQSPWYSVDASGSSKCLDTDMDGINDYVDTDDDNDGILDLDEGFCEGVSVIFLENTYNITLSDFDVSNGVDYVAQQGGDPSPLAPKLFLNGYDRVGGKSRIEFTYTTPESFNVDATGNIYFRFWYYDNILDSTGSYGQVLNCTFFTSQGNLTQSLDLNTFSASDINTLDNGGWIYRELVFTATPNTTISLTGFNFDIEGNGNGTVSPFNPNTSEVFAIAPLNISVESCNANRNTDADTFFDHLDVDSDNDGCFDALEGGDNILATNVQANGQLDGIVDGTTGVPNNVDINNGQTVGTSTNFQSTSDQCDDDGDGVLNASDVCDGANDSLDSDNDGVPDSCDLDDDNDGILDVDEGCNDTEFAGDDSSPTGSPSAVFISYPNTTAAFPPSNSNISSIISVASVSNQSAGSGLTMTHKGAQAIDISNVGALNYTEAIANNEYLEFSFTTTNSYDVAYLDWVGFYNRIDQEGFSVTYAISNNGGSSFTDLATFVETANDGGGTFPQGREAEDVLDYELLNNTTYTIRIYFYALGASVIEFDDTIVAFDFCAKNTDGDAFADYLDVDSDNDGCFDAIEGGDNILAANVQANGQLDGNINSTTGVPNNVDVNNGQAIGASADDTQYDADGQCDQDGDGVIDANDVCNGFDDNDDNDNDGVPDVCDQDDDNDGILDTQELCGTNPQPVNLESTIRVEIDLDQFPNETGWSLALGGNTIASVPQGTYGTGNVTVAQDITITENGNYFFTITDNFGDGIQGNSYRILLDGVIVINRTFGSPTDTTTFSQTDNFPVNTIVSNSFSCLTDDPNGDADGDGIINYQDPDFCSLNGNGVCASLDNDNDGIINSMDTDTDGDGCVDAIEAGHTDDDADGRLGNSPVTVNPANGRVTGQGGYTGTDLAVTNSGNTSACATCELLNASVSSVFCDDNGTPLDDSDDTFTFYISPNGNLLSATYSVSGGITRSNIPYDAPEQFGPFAISGGNITFTITDDGDGSCQLTNVVVAPPATCSTATAVDTDTDDVIDSVDIDNDNDGIIDDNENPCASRPITSGSWTGSNPYNNTAGPVGVTFGSTIPSGGSIVYTPNDTMTTNSFFSDPAVEGSNSLDFFFTWDTSPESLNAASDDAVIGTITITYAQPVYNPVIHIDRLGGNAQVPTGNYISNTSFWTLQTAGLSMAKISGNDQLIVKSNQFYREPNQNLGSGTPIVLSGDADSAGFGTAAGSIQIYGRVTTLTFQVTGEGLDGNGTDRLEMSFDACPVIDTDDDGTPDFLDTDSDGDGCPDAIEGSANFVAADLTSSNNLADDDEGAVNPANGVPTNAGSPQATNSNVTTATQAAITTEPTSQTTLAGGSVTYTAAASSQSTTTFSGGTPNYTVPPAVDSSANISYQWQESTDNGATWTDITVAGVNPTYSGFNTNTLTLTNVPSSYNGYDYQLVITHSENECILVDSQDANLTVNPLVAFSVGDVTVVEDAGTASVPVSIDNPSTVDTVVSITTVDNSATNPADYTTTTVTATIPAGQTTVDVTIPITDDTTNEPVENFTVTGNVISGNTTNTSDAGTVTINDDDVPDVGCTIDQTFDWSTSGWNSGETSNSYIVGGAPISFTTTPPSGGSFFGGSPAVAPFYQGDLAVTDDQLIIATLASELDGNEVNITIDLGASQVGLEGVNFSLFDIDGGDNGSTVNYREIITIQGFLDGTPINPIILGSSIHTIATNVVTADAFEVPTSGAASADGVLGVYFTSAVDQVVINFELAPGATYTGSSSPGFSLYNVNFCSLPAFTVGDVTVAEDNGSASVPVSIDNPSSVDTVVSITTVDNSATNPADYTTTTVTATIPAGQTTVDVTIPITDDLVGEPTEDFTVTGNVVSGNTSNASDSGTVTITDNDTPAFTVGDVTVAEDNGSASVPVSIDNPSSVDTVVSITTVDNSATNPADYTTTTVTATIPAGQTSVDVTIPITDDLVGEPTEDFTVTGNVVSGNTTNASDSGTVTITDNDTPAFTVGDVTVAEDNGSASVPVSIDNPSSVDTVVSITTVDNSATNPADYTTTTVTATIPAGQTSVDVTIPITDDLVGEPTEDFTVTGNVVSGNTTNASDSGTVTITDNDTPAFTVGDVTVAEDAGTASVPVSIDNPSSVDTVVSITTVDNSATNPADYTTTTVTATIPAGQTSVDVTIPITDDLVGEPTEDFTVTGNVVSGNTTNASDSGTVTITDNDTPAFTVGDVTVAEDNGSASVPVSIDNPSSVDTVVSITTVDNSATNPADYTTTTVTATIPAGQTTVDVTIPITDDLVGEPTEDFTVTGNVVSGNTSNASDSGTVTITDNDTPAFTVGDVTVAEDNGSASVPVSIDNPSSVDTVVSITTVDNSATNPADYTTTTVTATIPAGQTSVDVTIPITDDLVGEPTEDFTVTGNVVSGNTSNASDSGTVTITDNDTPAFTVGDVTVAEDAGTASVPVSIDNPSSVDTVVSITTVDNSATNPADYTTTTVTATIPAGQTSVDVTIPITDDLVGEPTEDFTVTGNVVSGNTTNASDSGTVTITDNDTPAFTVGDVTVAEDNGSTSVPVSIDNPSSVDTVVSITTVDNSATNPADYTTTTVTATIPAGQTSVDVTIPITDDLVGEPTEDFTVTGNVVSGNTTNASDSGTVTITDNDTPAFTVGDVTVAEDAGTASVPVSIDNPSSVDTVVSITTVDNSATNPADYTTTTVTATIPAGQTTVDVTIPITDDLVGEPTEDFTVTGNVVSGNTTNASDSGTVTITDNDTPAFTVGDVTVAEDNGSTSVPVSIDNPSSVDTVVSITTVDNSATNPADYTTTTVTATIPAGQTSVDVTIPITDDLVGEPTEDFTVTGNVVSGNTTNASDSGTVTITDNDTPAFTVGDVTVAEDAGTASVPVSIDNPSSVDTVVSITTVDNSATNPADYTTTTVTATIPAGQTSVDVTIPITDDLVGEPTEDFTVTGNVVSGNTTNASDSGTVTITDNDTPAFTVGDVTVAEDAGTASVPVSIDNPSSVDTVVSITTVDNSATNPADYTTTTVTATIPAGQTSVDVTIPITDDLVGEPTEDFTVTGNVVSGNTSNASDSGTVTITDNDTPAFTVGDVTVAEDAGTASVPVSIDNPSSVDTVVSITTVDNSATNPADYTTTTVTATIPAGQTSVDVTIPITDDLVGEPTEDFTVTGNVVSGNTTNASDSGTVTITDNDTPAFTVGDVTVAEDNGSASVPVSIDNPSSVDTVVSITTVDNSATNPADYTTTTVTATIPAGQTSVDVTIPITDDLVGEPTEDFTVTGNVVSGNTTNASDSGTVTITDNDTPAFTVGDLTVAEDAGTASVPVSIDNPSSVDTVVSITTVDNSATNPADYTTTTVTATIPAGQTSVDVTIPITDDLVGEPTEDFTVTGNVVSGNTTNASDSGTVTITDNDTPAFTVGDVTVAEDAGTASVPVSIDNPSSVDTVVSITTVDNSATNPADYTTTTVTATIPAGQTSVDVTIPITDDLVGEPTEDFTVTGNVVSGNTTNASDSGTVTITDNDTPAFTVGDLTVAEDAGTASVPVSIDNPSSVDTVVSITTVDNSATNPADYTTTTVTATIPAGQTSVDVTIPITDDLVGEPTEDFTVTGNVVSGNTSNASDSGTVTITDNDTPAFTVGDLTVAEDNGSASVPVSIDNPSSVDTVVSITTVDNSATNPADYTTTTVTATIPAGQTSVDVTIPITDDLVGEQTEDFTVTGNVVSGNTTNASDSGTVTITDNDTPAFTVGDVTVAEDNGSASVPVSIDNPSSVDTVVSITTVDNSATNPADYTTTTVTATIPAGQTSVDVTIPITDDLVGEPTEDFTVTGNVVSGNTTNASDSGTVTITDNDTPAFTVGDVTVAEDNGSASVPVSIDNPSSVDTVVSITTVDNSATNPADYTTTTVTATIPAGQTSVDVTIPITDDLVGEPTEDFTVTGNVVSGNTTNASDNGTVTITDNDTPAFTVGDVTVAEDAGTASVPVSIDNPSSVDTVVSITTVDNSATNPADYTTTTVMVTIPAGQTSVDVTIPITDDLVGEPTEDFTVTGNVVSGNTTNASDNGTVTITDMIPQPSL
ncbi:probable aggregation factor core protein MAFp3, isoform C [Kordia algicida OT-1]|uniref:Probable aggregation factor core protein MAFp3, isoform C n=1 Tax=Kordia algicida OT-1 TaxID=391587 RepID=A9E200_9FLAO|nr:Calx-beta domain-containing protein [Kordia algicida]EDP95696.1 probable aggregation factor core protein MAFp3, isoform C [Kordia algicida OT-1]